ncbi:ribonuclease P/MRP protein subunit POP5 [Meleagris gallopavo]|uniref:ribonuclease P/MRP protein subunit POP5 n=1 Tax=Meleagris gallopavo TaxID=9103 RepID=UPI0012AC0655|nr:ribonuclease P/MRP protein subunit POP5 [Meleagris gallopavo]
MGLLITLRGLREVQVLPGEESGEEAGRFITNCSDALRSGAKTTLGSKRAAPAGTIRTCQKFLIQYNRRQVLLLLQKCTSEEERCSVRQAVLSCSLTEEQAQSGEEEEEDGTETD